MTHLAPITDRTYTANNNTKVSIFLNLFKDKKK